MKKLKKAMSIIAIIVGILILLSVVIPLIIGVILEVNVASSVGIIGGADGPTTVLVVGTLGVGSIITEVVIGFLLIIVGIWGYRK